MLSDGSLATSRDIGSLDFLHWTPSAPARPGLSFTLCVSAGTEPGGRPPRWSVGHLRLPTNLVQMASLGPSRARGGAGGSPSGAKTAHCIQRDQSGGRQTSEKPKGQDAGTEKA